MCSKILKSYRQYTKKQILKNRISLSSISKYLNFQRTKLQNISRRSNKFRIKTELRNSKQYFQIFNHKTEKQGKIIRH